MHMVFTRERNPDSIANANQKATAVVLIPSAGLANRMRAVDSAMTVCERIRRPLEIVWTRHPGTLPVRFSDLFEPLSSNGVSLHEVRWFETPLYGHLPLRGGHIITEFVQKAVFGKRRLALSRPVFLMSREGTIPPQFFMADSRVLVNCGCQLVPTEKRFSMFIPLPALRSRIDAQLADLPAPRLGIHIRRGDHKRSIEHSPTSLFKDAIRRELDSGRFRSVFLASDSAEEKKAIRDAFGPIIVEQDAPLNRVSRAGIEAAVVDLWTLSNCDTVLGSSGSTFAETAAWMGQCRYRTLEIG